MNRNKKNACIKTRGLCKTFIIRKGKKNCNIKHIDEETAQKT